MAINLAFGTVALGVSSVAFMAAGLFGVGAVAGLAGGLLATYDELISTTTRERRLILVGFVLSVIGLAICMANGAAF